MKKTIANFTVKQYPSNLRIFEEFKDKDSNFYLIQCEDSMKTFMELDTKKDILNLINNE